MMDRCVALITGYMTGTTSEWFTTVAESNATREEGWPTLKAFWQPIEGCFGDANPKLTARAQLSEIMQGT